MSAILVDTNVLLDVVTDDAAWAGWSQRQLEVWALRGALVINAVIYAELSIGFERIEELETVLSETGIALAEIPDPALFLAGKIFRIGHLGWVSDEELRGAIEALRSALPRLGFAVPETTAGRTG